MLSQSSVVFQSCYPLMHVHILLGKYVMWSLFLSILSGWKDETASPEARVRGWPREPCPVPVMIQRRGTHSCSARPHGVGA